MDNTSWKIPKILLWKAAHRGFLLHGKTKYQIIQTHHLRSVAEVLWQKQRSVWKFQHWITFGDESTGCSWLSGKYLPFWWAHCPSCNYGGLKSSAFGGKILTNHDPHCLVMHFPPISNGSPFTIGNEGWWSPPPRQRDCSNTTDSWVPHYDVGC